MIKSTFCLIVTIAILSLAIVTAAPYQELEPRKGHVPVYIRYGNTPLSKIHPSLVEAFNEKEETAGNQLLESKLSDQIPKDSIADEEDSKVFSQEIKNETATDNIMDDIASMEVIKALKAEAELKEKLQEEQAELES